MNNTKKQLDILNEIKNLLSLRRKYVRVMRDNIIVNKSFHFAVKIIRLYQGLIKDKKEFILSKQILRCGCSIGANVEEAQGGFS